MSKMIAVNVLRTVRIAAAGTVYGREIVAGTPDQVPEDLLEDLRAGGWVEEAEPTEEVSGLVPPGGTEGSDAEAVDQVGPAADAGAPADVEPVTTEHRPAAVPAAKGKPSSRRK